MKEKELGWNGVPREVTSLRRGMNFQRSLVTALTFPNTPGPPPRVHMHHYEYVTDSHTGSPLALYCLDFGFRARNDRLIECPAMQLIL